MLDAEAIPSPDDEADLPSFLAALEQRWIALSIDGRWLALAVDCTCAGDAAEFGLSDLAALCCEPEPGHVVAAAGEEAGAAGLLAS